jgi:hypothetical protein
MFLIKNNIPNDDNEIIAISKTVFYCAKCNAQLPEDMKFVTKRVPNLYMSEKMRLKNVEYCDGDEEKAKLVNEVNEKVIIICIVCETKNIIHDYRWY